MEVLQFQDIAEEESYFYTFITVLFLLWEVKRLTVWFPTKCIANFNQYEKKNAERKYEVICSNPLLLCKYEPFSTAGWVQIAAGASFPVGY